MIRPQASQNPTSGIPKIGHDPEDLNLHLNSNLCVLITPLIECFSSINIITVKGGFIRAIGASFPDLNDQLKTCQFYKDLEAEGFIFGEEGGMPSWAIVIIVFGIIFIVLLNILIFCKIVSIVKLQ